MSTTVARWVLVGTAVVLVLTGTLVALPGAGRAALLGAGACCAALDVVVTRSVRSAPPVTVAVLPPAPGEPTSSDDVESASPATAEGPDPAAAPGPVEGPDPAAAPSPVEPSEPTEPAGTAGTAGTRDPAETRPSGTELDLGRTPDGDPVRVWTDGAARTDVAVVGTGTLAWAVYCALAAQLSEVDGSVEVRSAVAVDLADADLVEHVATPAVPPPRAGTAVSVALGSDAAVRASVVLVPDDGQRPRRVDVVVHVTRYGCTVTLASEQHGVPLDPALPLLRER